MQRKHRGSAFVARFTRVIARASLAGLGVQGCSGTMKSVSRGITISVWSSRLEARRVVPDRGLPKMINTNSTPFQDTARKVQDLCDAGGKHMIIHHKSMPAFRTRRAIFIETL